MAHIATFFVHDELKSRKNDRVPICGVSRAIAGTAGHPCQANATLARPRGQPPPRLSRRRSASLRVLQFRVRRCAHCAYGERQVLEKVVPLARLSDSIAVTASVLKKGQPAIFPTETVYGLGVSIRHAASPDILYGLKRREKAKPISWLVSQQDDLARFGRCVPEFAFVLARTFWPGPLTLIVKASDEVPEAFRSSTDTIGLRMPNNACALELINAVGCPLATTSANVSGKRPAGSFDDLDAGLCSQVSAVLSDGEDGSKSGIASTVVDCTQDHPVIVREGAITIADIKSLS